MTATRVVLLDLETSPGALDFVAQQGDFVMGFISEVGRMRQGPQLELAGFEVRVVPSLKAQAAPVAIVWELARLTFREGLRPSTPVWVISGDHRYTSPLHELVGGLLHALQVVSWPAFVASTRPQLRAPSGQQAAAAQAALPAGSGSSSGELGLSDDGAY